MGRRSMFSRNGRKCFAVCVCIFVSFGIGDAAYVVISSSTDPAITEPLTKIDTVIQDGDDARNRFTMHRVFRGGEGSHGKGVVILLPSLVNNFKEYTMNENQDAMLSLAATLALAQYDVYGFSPRTFHIPLNGCSSGTVDCSVMANWGFATYLADIAYIKEQARHNNPAKKPVIGGLSLGSMLGVAAVNAAPSDYTGLLLWEGIMFSTHPEIVTLNTANCNQDKADIAAGIFFNEGLSGVAKTAVNSGEEASAHLFGDPNPFFGTPTFITAVANATRTQFVYSSFARLKRSVLDFNDVESIAVLRDAHCSFAGDRTFTANVANFTGSIFAIKGGQAFGPYMADTTALFTGASQVRVQSNEEFGHVDAYMSSNHATYIETTILDWLNTLF